MNRAALARDLAPTSPPCFQDRLSWLEYLGSAAEHQRGDYHDGPLLFTKGQPVRFNFSFSFCADCTAQHSLAMFNEGRCNPAFLIDLMREAASAAA
jgi:hypothetical protein